MPLVTTCGSCGLRVSAKHVAGSSSAAKGYGPGFWRCPECDAGIVMQEGGMVFPTAPVGARVKNLPGDVDRAWQEARTAHGAAAYTASEIMCRKILMHLAVDVAGDEEGKTFARYVDTLDGEGHIAKGMRPAVDAIRARGNVANHELPASTEAESEATLRITEHLLRSIYEFTAPV